MTEERLKEIKNIFDIADIYGDDFEIARELYNEVVRLRKIIDNIIEELKQYLKETPDISYTNIHVLDKIKEIEEK